METAENDASAANEDALRRLVDRHQATYRSVGTMAYDILREAIVAGTFAPGQKLRQESLATSLGVSRLPVRSALIQLEAEGLVEFHARRGAVVKSLSAEQAREVYDIRMLLEQEALRLSMAELTPERVKRVRDLADLADAQKEGADFVDAVTRFYAEVYDARHRPVLWEMIEQLRLKVGRYMLGWRLVDGVGHEHSHQELADAVVSGDVERAADVLRAHLHSVRDGVVAMLSRDGGASRGA